MNRPDRSEPTTPDAEAFREVLNELGVTAELVRARCRRPAYVQLRRRVAWTLHDRGLSWPRIGALLGRTPGTLHVVLHGRRPR